MLNRSVARMVSILIIATLPMATALADVQGAMAYVQGKAKVNGRILTNSAAIFPGDAIQTAAGSTVSLVSKGSSVLVPEGSTVTYREKEVILTSGRAQVRTTGDMSARVAAFSVTPASGKPAMFEVARLGSEVRISAVSGSLSISDGKATTLLASGQTITLAANGTPTGPKNNISGDTGLIIMVFTAVAAGVIVGVANALASNDGP